MSDKTGIEWTDATWNPTIGCTRVSPGCDHCYAMRFARRFDGSAHAYNDTTNGQDWSGRVNLLSDRLWQPQRWRKPRRIFVNSMSDLFHDAIPDRFIADVFAVMALCPQHTFQVLTKRHGRMRSLLSGNAFLPLLDAALSARGYAGYLAGVLEWPLPNVWLGVSVEDQDWAHVRVPALLETPAVVRWVSAEPLLGQLLLYRYLRDGYAGSRAHVAERGRWSRETGLDWVVAGGESGPGARPIDPDWIRSLRDECAAAQVPFLFKQWGGVRKHQTGRHLDGQLHDEYPAAAA